MSAIWTRRLAGAIGLAATALAADFTQLTQTPFGFGMFEPSISADSSRVVFSAAYDFLGDNPRQNFEIFWMDLAAGEMLQLTQTPFGFGQFEPKLTPDGAIVVFRSAADLTGGNPDNGFELFSVSVDDGAIDQLTSQPNGQAVFEHRVSADGEWLVYRSLANPLGSNPEGNFEIFRLNRLDGTLQQVTQTPAGTLNDRPAVSGEGSRVVFRSRHNFDGTNPNGNVELWRWDAGSGQIAAITQSPTAQGSEAPSLDFSGRYVAFLSRGNFAGTNPGASLELFVADIDRGVTVQVTQPASGTLLEPTISPNGAYVLFETQRDLIEQNGDGNRELFLYDIAGEFTDQLTQTTGGVSSAQLSDRARIHYVAISNDGQTFAYRCDHSLDSSISNDGGNLELFLGSFARACPGDLDSDGAVTDADLGLLLSAFGTCPGDAGYSQNAGELAGDACVTDVDLGVLLDVYGETCP